MNSQEFLAMVQQNPWQTLTQLTKLAEPEISDGIDEPKAFVRSLIADLRESGQLVSAGKARGTRYACADAPAYQPPAASENASDLILKAINSGQSTSREIAKATGVDVTVARKLIRELVDAGKIDKTGVKRSARYWPLGKAKAASSKPKATTEKLEAPPRVAKIARAPVIEIEPEDHDQNLPQPEPEIERPKIPARDALILELKNLKREKVIALDKLLAQAADRGCSRFELSRLITEDKILGQMGRGADLDGIVVHCQMRYAHAKNYHGYCAYIWRPENDGDERPPEQQPMSEATFGAWSNADHLAASGVRSGRKRSKQQ